MNKRKSARRRPTIGKNPLDTIEPAAIQKSAAKHATKTVTKTAKKTVAKPARKTVAKATGKTVAKSTKGPSRNKCDKTRTWMSRRGRERAGASTAGVLGLYVEERSRRAPRDRPTDAPQRRSYVLTGPKKPAATSALVRIANPLSHSAPARPRSHRGGMLKLIGGLMVGIAVFCFLLL